MFCGGGWCGIDLVVRYVADMLELSLVRLYDWWDILVWLSLGPFTHGT